MCCFHRDTGGNIILILQISVYLRRCLVFKNEIYNDFINLAEIVMALIIKSKNKTLYDHGRLLLNFTILIEIEGGSWILNAGILNKTKKY